MKSWTRQKRDCFFICALLLLSSEANGFVPWRTATRLSFQLFDEQQPRRPSRLDNKKTSPTKRRPAASNERYRASPGSSQLVQDQVQFNQQIVRCADATEVLRLLQSKPLGSPACGGALSSINFSTALHRLARYSVSQSPTAGRSGSKQQPTARATTLTDPRFALFLASLGEALVSEYTRTQQEMPRFRFDSRELANIGWAIAKLRISPPQTVFPVDLEKETIQQDISANAQQVRNHIIEAARQRQQGAAGTTPQAAWIPALSRLAGRILDYIGIYLLEMDQGKHQGRRPFQMQEYSNLIWSFATAGRASPDVCCSVLKSMLTRQRQELIAFEEAGDTEAVEVLLQPQEWSNAIWSLATAQMEAAAPTVRDVLEYVSVLLVEYPEFAARFKPQEWSNTIWGTASLLSSHNKMRADGLTRQEESAALDILRVAANTFLDEHNGIIASMKSQELTNSIWSFSTLGFGLPPLSVQNNVNNYIVLRSRSPDEDAKLMAAVVRTITSSALPILFKFRSQELNNLAWALARLDEDISKVVSSDLLKTIGQELCNPRRIINTQDIGTTMWSMATMKYFDHQLYRNILARLTPSMISEAKPQELSNILWAIATADVSVDDIDAFDTSLVPKRPKVSDHVTRIFGLVGQELMRRPEQFKPQEIKDVLWSCSRVGLRFPVLFRATAEYLVGGIEADARYSEGRGLSDFSTQGLANLVWAIARQAQLAEDVSSRQADSRIASGNGRLVVYTTSYLDVGEKLLQKLFKSVAETSIDVHDDLRKLKPQDLCLTAWAFAVVGFKHSRFIETARIEVQRRLKESILGRVHPMNTFRGQELANFLWSMGTVHADAGELPDTLATYLLTALKDKKDQITAQSIASMFQRQELANIAWSCGVFWQFPEPLMRLLYQGLIGSPDKHDPELLIEAHGDTGLQPQAIMTLVYVQTALSLVGQPKSLSLPPDFPSRWQEPSPSRSLDHTTDSFLELKLSTSKSQRAVSAALERVGFDHVEEHVITMHDLLEEYGVNVPDSPYEVFSIDMANIEKRIAIEVDGPAHFINSIDHNIEVEAASTGYCKAVKGKLEYQFRWNGDRQEMNGSTFLKQILLTRLGWKVVNIPFWEWYALENDEAAEDAYCKTILASVDR